jgi:hypothetical protein
MSTIEVNSNVQEINPVQRVWAKTFLQFVTLDYCIQSEIERLFLTLENSDVVVLDDMKNEIRNNPYKLTSKMISKLEEIYNEFDGLDTFLGEDSLGMGDSFLNDLTNYYISILLQQILSQVLVNPRKLYEMQTIETEEEIKSASDSFGTTNKIDDDLVTYYRDLRNEKNKEMLETATENSPIDGEIEEILITVINSIADFSNTSEENILRNLKASYFDEKERENRLLYHLFQIPKTNDETLETDEEIRETTSDKYEELFEKSGLNTLKTELSNLIPFDFYGIINFDIFSDLMTVWNQLFQENDPEVINTLIGNLPKILEKFLLSKTESTSCCEDIKYRHNCLLIITDFIQKTLTPLRIEETSHLSQYPSAYNCLVSFRSLRAFKNIGEWHLNEYLNIEKRDRSRLGFLYVCYWCLSPQPELGILFGKVFDWFGKKIIDKNYGISEDEQSKINPFSMFPGSLERSIGSSVSVIDMDYETDKRRFKNKESRLQKPGELEKVLNSDGVRWLI